MPYTKTVWDYTTTPVNPTRLNNIENGVETNDAEITDIKATQAKQFIPEQNGSKTSEDLNTINFSGFYYAPNTALNTPVSNKYFSVIHTNDRSTTTGSTQIAIQFDNGAMYKRKESSGVWNPWVKLAEQTDIDNRQLKTFTTLAQLGTSDANILNGDTEEWANEILANMPDNSQLYITNVTLASNLKSICPNGTAGHIIVTRFDQFRGQVLFRVESSTVRNTFYTAEIQTNITPKFSGWEKLINENDLETTTTDLSNLDTRVVALEDNYELIDEPNFIIFNLSFKDITVDLTKYASLKIEWGARISSTDNNRTFAIMEISNIGLEKFYLSLLDSSGEFCSISVIKITGGIRIENEGTKSFSGGTGVFYPEIKSIRGRKIW